MKILVWIWNRIKRLACYIFGHDWMEGTWRGKTASGLVIAVGEVKVCIRCGKSIAEKTYGREGE